MQTDAEVAAIAAGLTLAQRECLLNIPERGSTQAVRFSGDTARQLRKCCRRRPALLAVDMTKEGRVHWYRHTADGLRVAQHLKQENAK